MTLVHAGRDPYLEGLYAPVPDEMDATELPISGSLPDRLDGTYVRNGPNPRFAPRGRYHVFDGDGMLHGVTISGGRAGYRNRWISSRGLEAEIAAGHALYGGMANADFAGPDLVGDAGPIKNVANTHVVRHAGRTLCLWEAGPPTEVTEALETVGPFDFAGRLPGAMTAHPKIDPVSGEMLCFGYSALPPYLRYHVVDPSGALTRTVDVDLPAPVMMHDFAITAEHVVFLDAPAVFDFAAFARGEPMIQWQPERGTRLGVMPRGGEAADLRWFEIDPCYVFHFMNAWSTDGPDGGTVTVDACRLERMDIGLEAEGATPGADGYLTRFTVDLASSRVTTERRGELPGDFPRIAPAVEGRPNRFGYTATFGDGVADQGRFDTITKHDHEAGTETHHRFGPDEVTGEAVFAPDPDGTGEDEGWVLAFVSRRDGASTDLAVLDAGDLDEVARVHLPRRVPFGFHGNWFARAT